MKKNIILLCFSVLLCAAGIIILEAATRILFPEINLQGTQVSLFREKAFGNSVGLQPNAAGIAFDKKVFTDESGFRKMEGPEKFNSAWLILGDSVAFGVGVETEATFAGMLQRQYPKVKVWNTAVPGYSILNYKDVMIHFMNSDYRIKKIFLFLCLNDIRGYLRAIPREKRLFRSWVDLLFQNSKFFLLTVNTLFDRPKAYFFYEYNFYDALRPGLARSLKVMDEMAETAKRHGADFTVIILPFEYQLRTRKYLLPQELLSGHFKEKGISYMDAFKYFEKAGVESRRFYLYLDAMHLSELGHKTVFGLLKEYIDSHNQGGVRPL